MTCRENLLSPKNHWWSQESALHDILIELWEILKSICFLLKHEYIYIYIYTHIRTKLKIKIIGLDFGGGSWFRLTLYHILNLSYESCDQTANFAAQDFRSHPQVPFDPALTLWIFDDWFDEHSTKLGPIKIVPSYHSCRWCVFFFEKIFKIGKPLNGEVWHDALVLHRQSHKCSKRD